MHCVALFHTAPPQLAGFTVTDIPWGKGMSVSNPGTSCGDLVWGSALTQFMGSTHGTFSLVPTSVGGELLPLIMDTSPVLKSRQGRDILLLWTGLTWPQGIVLPNNVQPAWQVSEGQGKGKDEHVKREKIGCGRIRVGGSPSSAHFGFPPFLQPATQAKQWHGVPPEHGVMC